MAHNDQATDRGRSWVVAACCCFCNLTFYGVSRLSGMMLVAATHTFHVSRARAAVPFSLSTAIRNLAGVFVGHLAHRFGVGPIVGSGCLIASLGAGLCFFATDMQWLTVCWGGLFGIGFGLSTCLLPLAINQNFVKHSGKASGISYSGSYIGSFIFPPIVVWLLENFGLQGTFLIISGGVLNVFAAAMLLKGPKPAKKCSINEVESVCSADTNTPAEVANHQSNQEVSFTNENTILRRNLRRIYDCSHNVFTDFSSDNKQNFKRKISLTDSLYSFQGCVPTNSSSSEKLQTSNMVCKISNALQFKAMSDESPTLHSSSVSLSANYNELIHQKTHHMIISPSKVISDSCAKENSSDLKLYSRKLDFETRSLSKGKSKAKYKMKLQKLKKVLLSSLLNKTHFFRTECLQADNVKLTSFKYLHTFLCPNLSTAVIPNNQLYLSSLQSIASKQCPNREQGHPNYLFLKKFNNYSITFPKEQICNKSVHSNTSNEVIEPEELLSRLDASLKDNTASLFLKEKYLETKIAINSSTSTEEITTALRVSNLQKFETSENNDCIDISCSKLDINNLDTIRNTTSEAKLNGGMLESYHELNLSPQFFVPEVKFKPEKGRLECPVDTSDSPKVRNSKKCFADLFCMLSEPMFIVISFTMSIQTFIVVCVVTTIEDYAKDVGIPENRVHYALMALSIANLVGTLTLGAITDRGYISRHRFLSLCFLGMSISLVAVSLVAVSLESLLAVITIYGLLESGVIITFPILTKQFVKGEKRQAVAIASSNVLSAPTVMLVPMLIGHFRDNIGCYSGLFHLLGATSFTCCLVWLVAPSIIKRRKLKKLKKQTEHC